MRRVNRLLFVLIAGVTAGSTGCSTMSNTEKGVGLGGLVGAGLGTAVGAATGRRAMAIGVASTAAVAAYVLYVAGELVDSLQRWQPFSPFHQALTGGPLGAGLPLAYLWMPLAAAVFIAAALPVFDRRDIAAR